MRKIIKDTLEIPRSLQVPIVGQSASIPTKTTHKRRLEIIENQNYIDHQNFNSRYKYKDIKSKLKAIYHSKCAYCEKQIETGEVEHYRPKSTYYWLAFSWDNLLLCCGECNRAKGKKFEITGQLVTYNQQDLAQINCLTTQYNAIEKPKLVHPELENIASLLTFDDKSKAKSKNERVDYTIKTCKLNRDALIGMRHNKIYRKLIGRLENIKLTEPDVARQKLLVKRGIQEFIKEACSKKSEFYLYRQYLVTQLPTIIKSYFP